VEIVERLQTTRIFEGIETEALEALVKVMKQQTVPIKTLLFEKDAPGNEMFIILRGKVRIFIQNELGQEFTIRHFGAGEIFGEFTLLDEQSRSTSADVTEDADLITLDRETFLEFLKSRPTIGLRMMRNLSARVRYTTTYLQTVIDSTKLMSEGKYHDAISNIEDSPNADIHNLVLAFVDMIESVQKRNEELQQKLDEKEQTQK
jgi:CRP-like cAMP-binding protein